MARLSVQDEYQSGDNVTATNLNNLVNQANFVAGASNTTDDSTLEVHTSGYLKVKNNGVGDEHLQQMTNAQVTTAGNENGRAVTTDHIRNDAVTYAKIQNVSATNRVLGRDSSGAGNVEEITPSALRTMINVEDGAQANPGNATTTTSGLMSASDKEKLNNIDEEANDYSLPVATALALGGVKEGGDINIDGNGLMTLKSTAVPQFFAFSSNGITSEGSTQLFYPSGWTGGTPSKVLVSTRYPSGDASSQQWFQVVSFNSTSVTVFCQSQGVAAWLNPVFADVLLVKN